MTPHSAQTDPAASDKQFCRGFHFVNPSAKAGLPLMPARAFSRTETIGSVITIIFSGSKLIVFGRNIIFLRPAIIIADVKKTISGTEIIMSGSNYIASLPDLIVLEATIIMFEPEMIVSKLEISISTTTKTARVSDLTATMANKTASMTEKTATVTTKTATIVEKTATIGGLCKYMKWLYLNGHRKDRYDGIDNYLRPQEDRYENGDGY